MAGTLLKIGDFARLCNTTVDTLLHYDRLGLLKPAEVRSNGYRYYMPSQVNRYISIRAMALAQFPLADAAELLNGRNLNAFLDVVQDRLRTLHEEIEQLHHAQGCLEELAHQTRHASALKLETPEIVRLPERYYLDLGVHMHASTVAYSESMEVLDADMHALERLMAISPAAALSPYGQASQGPIDGDVVEFDNMFYLIDNKTTARKLGDTCTIPAGTYARISGVRPWDNTTSLHRALIDFAVANGGDPNAVRYEYSAFRLFDSNSENGFDDYLCTVIMQVE